MPYMSEKITKSRLKRIYPLITGSFCSILHFQPNGTSNRRSEGTLFSSTFNFLSRYGFGAKFKLFINKILNNPTWRKLIAQKCCFFAPEQIH